MSPEIARQWIGEFFGAPGLTLLLVGLYAVQARLARLAAVRHVTYLYRLDALEARLTALERQRGRTTPWPVIR